MPKPITAIDGPAPGDLTYRAFHMSPSGKITHAEIIETSSDDEAKNRASQLVNGHGIDLWERARFLASYSPLNARKED